MVRHWVNLSLVLMPLDLQPCTLEPSPILLMTLVCVMLWQFLVAHLSLLLQDTALSASGSTSHPNLGLPADILSMDHEQGPSCTLFFSLTKSAWQ